MTEEHIPTAMPAKTSAGIVKALQHYIVVYGVKQLKVYQAVVTIGWQVTI